MGVRHGHPVVVNRQLCIANAFEQVLEEKRHVSIASCVVIMTAMAIPLPNISRKNGLWTCHLLPDEALGMDLLIGSLSSRSQSQNPIAMQYIQPLPEGFSP